MAKAKRDYAEIVRIYNSQGKVAAKQFIQDSYGVKDPWYILRVLKDSKGYRYDNAKDKYIANTQKGDESLFIGLEELCKGQKQETCQKNNMTPVRQTRNKAVPSINNMFYSLMQDRLTEISKYIEMEQSNASITINVTALKASGYHVCIN